AAVLECPCYVTVARTVPAAAAAVREQHDTRCARGNTQASLQIRGARADSDLLLLNCRLHVRLRCAWCTELRYKTSERKGSLRPVLERSSNCRISSSVVCEKSSYQRPTE